METVSYKKLNAAGIAAALFDGFSRHQEVKRCWRKESGQWVLKEVVFTEEWGDDDFAYLAAALRRTLLSGGAVIGAFCGDRLAGFASVENSPFGSDGQYLNLSNLHVSSEQRGLGIGKRLFALICEEARRLHAGKLYISAHSSQESQAFYHALGCVEAMEYNRQLAEEEPCDCQMEFAL